MRYQALLSVMICLSSCNDRGETFDAKQKDQVVAEVKVMMNGYYDEIRKNGLLGEFRYLDSSADFFWVPPGYSGFLGYDSVAAILRQNAPVCVKVDNRWLALHIVPLSRGLANYTGQLTSAVTDTSGRMQTTNMLETGTLIKRKDGWKLLCGQTSIVR